MGGFNSESTGIGGDNDMSGGSKRIIVNDANSDDDDDEMESGIGGGFSVDGDVATDQVCVIQKGQLSIFLLLLLLLF